MPPNITIPDEIDLFTGPHSRMKELVQIYEEKVRCVDFSDLQQLFALLDELKHTLFEFKSHESIENMFIMEQLKNRLKQRHIYNSAVCNCHKDNKITEMMSMIKNRKSLKETSLVERQHFGQKLQKKFLNFVKDFIPHMEEEENIFQPLLVEHFDYEELRILKEAVVEQHELIKDPQYLEKASKDTSEIDEAIKDFRDLDENFLNLGRFFEAAEKEPIAIPTTDNCTPKASVPSENYYTFAHLPTEILVKIFKYLKPPDLGRSAQVCRSWNNAVYSTSLWRNIYPIQWARGIWEWENMHLDNALEDQFQNNKKLDDDADIDESEIMHEQKVFQSIVKHLLSRVGKGVREIVMDSGYNIPPTLIRKALRKCPNLMKISAAYTQTTHEAFTNVSLNNLQYLDLQGCSGVNDALLHSLKLCLQSNQNYTKSVCNNPRSFNPNLSSYKVEVFCPCMQSCVLVPQDQVHQNLCLMPGKDSVKFCFCRNHWVKDPSEIHRQTFIETDIEECVKVESTTKTCEIPSEPSLKYLNLSGCHSVQGYGLLSLSNSGMLWNLNSLNLSGCFQVSSQLLNMVAQQCPNLQPGEFNYCDNIQNGPFASTANGCDSLSHPLKICCRSGIVN